MRNFYENPNKDTLIWRFKTEHTHEVIREWKEEVPEYVRKFNSYIEDRNAVIFFELFIEFHIERITEILFPGFISINGYNKPTVFTKIKTLEAFNLFPSQIFEACQCIINIRNVFAHHIDVTSLDDLNNLDQKTKKQTINKLNSIIESFDYSDYDYFKSEDTNRNRFKSLVMNTITALRLYEPQVIEIRALIESHDR